jgi:sulfoquinovose isomerase
VSTSYDLTAPDHRAWLDRETARLLDFTKASLHPGGGFAWMDGSGRPVLDEPVQTWITTRMTHVLAIGLLRGDDTCAALVDHGVAALTGLLHDPEHGGWFAAADRPGDGEKRAYEHAFVLLAASSATVAKRPGAEALLDSAAKVILTRFWDDDRGVLRDVCSRDWSTSEPYGGANANMHAVEAFLAAFDATGDRSWLDRALRIATFFIDTHARANDWRIPEHFDADWRVLPEYNRDTPAHQFRPYGATVGHGFEWARLFLHLEAALGEEASNAAPVWLAEAARGLFERATADGWQGDGFLYTTDWSGTPVVRDRLHWVVCEAIAAAGAFLTRAASNDAADPAQRSIDAQRYATWWELADRCFIDGVGGSWFAQLDEANQPATSVWSGKPDTYHAFQATLLPRVPLTPSLTAAVARRLVT